MQGNIFICLNEATYNGSIPSELQGQYARKSYDEEGDLIEVLNTTFEEVAIDNRVKFGNVIELSIEDAIHYVLELDCSWLGGEVSALLALGDSLEYPSNCLMTNEEAMALIAANTDNE